jgi:antagonist of KipI
MSTQPCLEVLDPGLLTTVQNTRGRVSFERFDVPTGGALDSRSAAAANLPVGNEPGAAVLEITLVGPTLRFTELTAFAITGADLSADLDGQPVSPVWGRLARADSILSFGERRAGVRAYLAVAGMCQSQGGALCPPVVPDRVAAEGSRTCSAGARPEYFEQWPRCS